MKCKADSMLSWEMDGLDMPLRLIHSFWFLFAPLHHGVLCRAALNDIGVDLLYVQFVRESQSTVAQLCL